MKAGPPGNHSPAQPVYALGWSAELHVSQNSWPCSLHFFVRSHFFPHTKLLRLVLSQALDLSSKFSDLTSETSEICPSYRQLDCQPLCLECEAKAVLYVCAYNLTLPHMDIWPNLLAWGHHCFPSWSIFLRESHHLTFQTVPLFLPIGHLIQLLLPSQTSQVSPSV